MKNKNELVVKSNRLVEASYRLTLAEQRIILLAISDARHTGRGLNANDFLSVRATDYAKTYDLPPNQAYEQIKDASRTLFYREFILYDTSPDTGKERVIKARWVSAASYIDGDGVIQLQFSGVIVPYITRLEAEFTRYKLEKVAHMSSAYAIRLYELLMQWGSVGRLEIELEWLKKALMVDKNYERLDNFKKWVLDVALSQINEHSDLTASYSQRKTGRNVTHLTFAFAPKEDAAPSAKAQDAPAGVRESALFQRLRGHGIGTKLAAAWIKQDEARALALVEHVEALAKAGQVKKSTAGYLRSLFENGAEVGPSAFDAQMKTEAAQAREAARRAKEQAQREEAEQRARKQADNEATDRAKQVLNALPPEAWRGFAVEFLQGPGSGLKSWDDKTGKFRDPVEGLHFKGWLLNKFKHTGQKHG